jgi:tetratricopeptide (TPR) repeat protein
MASKVDPRCPNCGHRSSAINGGGLILSVSADEYLPFAALMAGEFDEAKCESCNFGLKAPPTIVLISHDPNRVTVFFGPLAKVMAQHSVDEIKRSLGNDWILSTSETIEDLKTEAARLVKLRLQALASAQLADLKGSLVQHLSEHWQSLTAEVFTAGRMALTVPLPGVSVAAFVPKGDGTGSSPDAEDAIRSLAHLQANTFLGIWIAWHEHKVEPSLESALKLHIKKDALVEGSAEIALQMLDNISSGNINLPFRSEYALEAIRASIHAAAGTKNPRASEWARFFFQTELAHVSSDQDVVAASEEFLISEERAKNTVTFEGLWDAFLSVFKGPNNLKNTDLVPICLKAGHPELLQQLPSSLEVRYDGADPVEFVKEYLKLVAPHMRGNYADDVPIKLVQPLLNARDVESLERIAAAIAEQRPGDRNAEAAADSWLGAMLKVISEPMRYLKRIGFEPRPWEHNIQPRAKARLWMERSNHLRLLGRPMDALRALEAGFEAGGDAIEPGSVRIFERNRAILLRETGSPDLSVDILTKLNQDAEGREKLDVLESLSCSYFALGEDHVGLSTLDQAIAEARGPFASNRRKLTAVRAMVASRRGAFEALMKLETQPESDSETLALAAAWANSIEENKEIPEGALDELENICKSLGDLVDKATKKGAFPTAAAASRLLGSIIDRFDFEEAGKCWELAYNIAQQFGVAQDSSTTLELAYRAYLDSDLKAGRRYLSETVLATGASYGGVEDFSKALGGAERMAHRLRLLGNTALGGHSDFADVRLIAEMQRDTLSRARSLRSQSTTQGIVKQFEQGISNEQIARLAPTNGSVGILEWVNSEHHIAALLTVVRSNGEVSAEFLSAVPVDLREAGEALKWNLSTWTRKRRGEPFDMEEWTAAKEWLLREGGSYLQPGDHLVVIGHKSSNDIPWHVATAGRWTCSYASGWLSLLALPRESRQTSRQIKVALIPEALDSDQVIAALRASAHRTKSFAASRNLGFHMKSGPECDFHAFSSMLSEADVAKVLCHGYVHSKTRDVAWLISDGRGLPASAMVTSDSSASAAFRFGWRDAGGLHHAATAVFSAACSSGFSHIAGVGDQLGLMAGLQSAGTRSFIAPRWDIVAEDVLPILDDGLERFCRDGHLAESVAEACAAAPQGTPDWVRWAIAIEGDWR